MRRTMIVVGLILILGNSGRAFAVLTNDFISDRVQQLKTQLALSDDQTAKIQAALKKALPPADQKKFITPSDRAAFDADQRDKWIQAKAEMNSVLTVDQKQKYVDFIFQKGNEKFWGSGDDAWRNRLSEKEPKKSSTGEAQKGKHHWYSS